MNNLIISAGTGRCGTKSLAKLLDGCKNGNFTHEESPIMYWGNNDIGLKRHLNIWKSRLVREELKYVGDVAFYWLPWIEEINKKWEGKLRVIFLKRNKKDTVNSYLRWVKKRNHWQDHNGQYWNKDRRWDSSFPSFDISNKYNYKEQKRIAVKKYYDMYYNKARKIVKHSSINAKIIPMEYLNTNEGQEKIFEFAGIDKKDRNFQKDCRYNVNS